MEYEKPLIFIYPISETLMNLKKAIEASGQPVDIYEIEDLREVLQTIPALGQALVLGSHTKKCAKLLQVAKKLIKQYDTKVVIISQKQYPRKTVDKLMKFGLNDIIFEPVPAKTLMYKVNLALRSLSLPTKKEVVRKFTIEQNQAKKTNDNNEDITFKKDQSENQAAEENEDDRYHDLQETTEESEEELLASMQQQKINPVNDRYDGFNPNDLNTGNKEQITEKEYEYEATENESEEELLASIGNQTIKKTTENNSDFDQSDFNQRNANLAEDEKVINARSIDSQESDNLNFDINNITNEDIGSQIIHDEVYETDGEDVEQMISIEDLSESAEDGATNLKGETQDYLTHMQGKGNTEHLEDDIHEMSEQDMEFAEMEALSEISNLNTKMVGKNLTDESIDDLMQGEVRGQESINDNMVGDVNEKDSIDQNMHGEIYGEEAIQDNMVGDVNLAELTEGGNLEGDVLSELTEEGNLTGDILSELTEDGNLEGNILSKEKNIKTYYDSEGINHQDQYEPNLTHSGNDQKHGGHMEGEVQSTEQDLEDDLASLMAEDADLNDLMGNNSTEEINDLLEGDIYNSLEEQRGELSGTISEDLKDDALKGQGKTDQIKENELDGQNNSIMADQGKGMTGQQAGTDHIETHYNTNFAEKFEKQKKKNPLVEFQTEEDYYGEGYLTKPKKKSALDMHTSQDMYGKRHTRSLKEDKEKRSSEDWKDQIKPEDAEYTEAENQKRKKSTLEMQYEMESDWSNKKNQKLKAQYTISDIEDLEKEQEEPEEAQISIDEQYAAYEDIDIESLIDDFGSDEEFGDEHVEELKELAKSLKSQASIYDDFEPEDYIRIDKKSIWDDDFEASDKKNKSPNEPIDDKDALGLDTLVALSQIYQTVTKIPKEAIYTISKLFWTEHKCLCCSLNIDKNDIEEIYNSITDPIISQEYLKPDEWNVIRTKTLQSAKKSPVPFWQGSEAPGSPKLYFHPFLKDDFLFGGILFYFPDNIETSKSDLYQTFAESMKMFVYSYLPKTHTLKEKREKEENPIEKETLFGRVKVAYRENFVEEKVDESTGRKGTKFGNWLKERIEKLAS